MYSDIFVVGDESIPVFQSYLVSFSPNKPIPLANLVVAKKAGKKWEYAGNTMGESENVYTAIRQFGEFCLIEYLSLALDEDEVNPAAGGWGGRSKNGVPATAFRSAARSPPPGSSWWAGRWLLRLAVEPLLLSWFSSHDGCRSA